MKRPLFFHVLSATGLACLFLVLSPSSEAQFCDPGFRMPLYGGYHGEPCPPRWDSGCSTGWYSDPGCGYLSRYPVYDYSSGIDCPQCVDPSCAPTFTERFPVYPEEGLYSRLRPESSGGAPPGLYFERDRGPVQPQSRPYFDEKGGGNCTCSKEGTCESCRRKDAENFELRQERGMPERPRYSEDPREFYQYQPQSPPGADVRGLENELRNQQAVEGERFPIDTPLHDSRGQVTSLRRILSQSGASAVLLDFWATWCGPCVEAMPELKNKAALLRSRGVVVAGMNIEGDLQKTALMGERQAIDFPWLVEPQGNPFSRQFGIDSVPRALLIDAEGRVLFNGHPSDAALDSAIARLSQGWSTTSPGYYPASYESL